MPTALTGKLDCQETARHYFELVRSHVKTLGFSPGLGVVLGSDDPGSVTSSK